MRSGRPGPGSAFEAVGGRFSGIIRHRAVAAVSPRGSDAPGFGPSADAAVDRTRSTRATTSLLFSVAHRSMDVLTIWNGVASAAAGSDADFRPSRTSGSGWT